MERDIYTIRRYGQYHHYPRYRRGEVSGWLYYIDGKAKTKDTPYPKLWFATEAAAQLFIDRKRDQAVGEWD
jgi:hypothetical protein